MDPFTIIFLGVVVSALARGEPIPVISNLLNPQKPGAPGARPPAPQQPVIPRERIALVAAMRDGARWFNASVCFSLFEMLKSCQLEQLAVEGRQAPPGAFRLVPWRAAANGASPPTAAELVMVAAGRGFVTLLNLAVAFQEYASADKIIMFAASPTVAAEGTQLAVLGPIQVEQAPATPKHAAPRPMPPPPKARSYEEELEHAAKDGLPTELVRAALVSPDIDAKTLDDLATTLPQYPLLALRLRERAGVARAREQLENALTQPSEVFPAPPAGKPVITVNGAGRVVAVEGTSSGAEAST